MGSMRPTNISVASRCCAAGCSWEVIPVERPTVPKADVTSKRTASSENGVISSRTRVVSGHAVRGGSQQDVYRVARDHGSPPPVCRCDGRFALSLNDLLPPNHPLGG